jgi:outer membrane protein assembly factor BamA
MQLGANYIVGGTQSAMVFVQRRQSILNGVDTNQVKSFKRLPAEADVSSSNLGVSYTFNNTDYRFNPSKGNEFSFSSSAGTKKIRKNNQVLELKDPSDPSYKFVSLYDTVKLKAYQFRVSASGAQYFSLGGQSTIKLGLNSGVYQSANYFRNELFQIGGIKLLRGFDEESQFVSRYAIGTMEYRYRIDLNSYFFAFADGGWGKHLLETKSQHAYFGTGIGMSLETKAGIINLAWAVGKRDDTKFNLRQSKVHLGFASYF